MDINDFLQNISHNDLILTANRRLSAYLQKNFDQLQIKLGKSAWQSPKILPLSSWIETSWHELNYDSHLLLSDFQELLFWEQIIVNSKVGSGLLNIISTARLVKDTWKILNDWLLQTNDISSSNSLDVETFIKWVAEFKSKCHQLQYISRAEILPELIKRIEQQTTDVVTFRKIFFIGFDEPSPAVSRLQFVLQQKYAVQNIHLTVQKEAMAKRLTFTDKKIELQEMARWAYRVSSQNPNGIIGCVFPNLSERREEILHCFKEVYDAEGWYKNFSKIPFNISAANHLGQFTLIQVALKILSLNRNEIYLEDVASLLRTPFIKGSETELNKRAMLDVNLYALGEKKIILNQIVSNATLNSCSLFKSSMSDFLTLKIDTPSKQSINKWIDIFIKQLHAMGWPGERSLNSTEYQLVERFKNLLIELTTINEMLEEIPFHEAFSILQQLTNTTLFQPKSDDVPIQILGILEASGIAFDYLWVAGLDNETWPAPPSPNPFIPFEIQKKFAMPHATSERELQFSLNVTQRFLQNAKTLIFSHAEYDGDRQLAPSPLVTLYPETQHSSSNFVSVADLIYQTKKVESFIDDFGPVVISDRISGGSALFKAQAACPFQAFAKYRLHAQSIDNLQIGLAFHERGTLIHDILARLWREIKTHEKLCTFSDDELNTLIQKYTFEVISSMQEKKNFSLKTNFFALEKKRIQKLIFNWLQIEKMRQPFEVISCEEKQLVQIGKLAIQIQIDRVDRLSDSTELIIDYKTGKPSVNDWFSERPEEPQLPLYSVLSQTILVGILFAQVRTDEMRFKGLTAWSDIVPGATTLEKFKAIEIQSFQMLVEYWQKIIHQLADDFYQGKAQVAPKDHTTCQYCDLQALCRINHIH